MKPLRPAARIAPIVDLVLVVAFVLIGRVSHSEDLSLLGIVVTLWPFLVGLIAGWLVTRSWNAPLRILWNGVTIWVVTVLVGVLLRGLTGQGAALAFVVVATVVLGVFLLGWRAIALLIRRSSRSRSSAQSS